MAAENEKRASDRDEIEKLLVYAETLESRLEASVWRTAWLMFTGLCVFSLMVCVWYYNFVYAAKLQEMLVFTLVASAVGMLIIAAIIVLYLRTLTHGARDRRAVREIAGIIREVEQALNLTALERAEVRIRLSRFDIGPTVPQKKSEPYVVSPFIAPPPPSKG